MGCIQINPKDNIAIANRNLKEGEEVALSGLTILIREQIPAYHKVSIGKIEKYETVYRYGVSIGEATETIEPGSHVHLHNMKSTYLPTYKRKGE